MDFLKILKSLEEFVYEALAWLILVPRTLLRILLHPVRMAAYARAQLLRDDAARFDDAVSPPLLLILCVLLAHFFDMGVRPGGLSEHGALADSLLASEQNILVYRTIAFGIWALAGSVYFLARTGQALGRESLRGPFYEQCYLVAPFALAISIGTSLLLLPGPGAQIVASVLMLASTAWLFGAQCVWVRQRTGVSRVRSLLATLLIIASGSALNAAVGHALLYTPDGADDAPVDGPARDDDVSH